MSVRAQYRSIAVCANYTIIDRDPVGRTYVRDTPADTFAQGLRVFLLRMMAVMFGGEGVVVLTRVALDRLGELVEVEGFERGQVGPFTTYRQGAKALHLAQWDQMEESRCPLWEPGLSPIDFIGRLRAWHDATGHAYRGTPGVAGTAILRAVLEGRPKAPDPQWFLQQWDEGWKDCERAYNREQFGWSPEDAPGSGVFEHEYDLTDAYPAAAGSAYLARKGLSNRRDLRGFEPGLAGFWLVDVAPWPADSLLPDPAGYRSARGRRQNDGPRWVTSPTLALLTQLHEAGEHGGFSVKDAWVEKGYQELRPLRETLKQARAKAERAHPDADAGEVDAIAKGLKLAAHEALGMTARKGGRLYRPDWQQTVLALARANMWRKMWSATNGMVGPFPHRVNTDAVYYASTEPDPWKAAPPLLGVLPAGEREAGKFKVDVDGLGVPVKTREVAW